MSPADRPDPSPEPLPDDPDGSAPGPPEPEDLDVLVDRLAAEQARQSEAAPEQGPGSALLAEEMTTLLSILDGQREAVARKVDGLDDGQASGRMVASATTVTGIIRHLADTERFWFREVVGGLPGAEAGYRWFDEHDHDAEWRLEPGAALSEALADYTAACEHSRAQIAGRSGEEEVRALREVRTVRWVVTHMIAETSRHLGHLDVLTELLDGRTGV